jgi:uncharacterized protein (DUF58 family)
VSDTLTFPLLPRRRVTGLAFGAMRSRARGYGTDLAGARPYRPGDDVRRIDWRASARLSSARGSDDFVVREHLTEEATRVVVVVDPSPTMELYPPEFPWLSKPAVIREACAMVEESALQAGCAVDYLDRGPGEPLESMAELLGHLAREERTLPPGTFVFLLSDFLAFPAEDVWQEALDRSLDLVPVVIQDPVWEQSFPDAAGAVLPLADQATGRISHVRLSRGDVRKRREENRARLTGILDRLEALGLDYALVSSHDPGHVLAAFVEWAMVRHQGARLA